MALQIIGTVEKPIVIKGTNVTVASVYNRLAYVAQPDGITMEIANYFFADENFYDQGIQINTDLPNENLIVKIDIGKKEQQSLEAAEKYTKIAFESLGYEVEIL
jgi:hypothetical protein